MLFQRYVKIDSIKDIITYNLKESYNLFLINKSESYSTGFYGIRAKEKSLQAV